MVEMRTTKLERRKATNLVVMKYYPAKMLFSQNHQSYSKRAKLPQKTKTELIAIACIITRFSIK